MWYLAARATSPEVIPGQTVSVRYRPQNSGVPKPPTIDEKISVIDLQESTPQSMCVGWIDVDFAWTSTRLGLAGAFAACTMPPPMRAFVDGSAPMTAV